MADRSLRTQVAVVGGGTAGLAAAVRAAELGIDALVLEKTDRLGGMLHLSSGHFSAAGTRRQAARGIVDSTQAHFEDVMRVGHGRNQPDLVRMAVEEAPAMVDWLDDRGFAFADQCPAIVSGHEPYKIPRTYWGRSGSDGGLDILAVLQREFARSGTARTGCQVTGLVVEDGRVTGLEAEDSGGLLRVEAAEVVMATGGYGASRALLTRHQAGGEHALIGCLDHASGDGHLMLERLGVEMTHADTYVPTMGLIEDPDRPGHSLRLGAARLIVNAVDRIPFEVWVNDQGERFVAEDTSSPDRRERALLAQHRMAMWSIWDEAALAAAPSPPIGPGWTAARVREEASRGRWCWRAESLGQLARLTGLPPAALDRTIRAYNGALGGPDPLGRVHRPGPIEKAPFYAARSAGGLLLSRGGPPVDAELRPRRRDGLPIAGLRAVGELLGMGQFSGDAFASGMSVGPALALGRRAMELIGAVGAAGGMRR